METLGIPEGATVTVEVREARVLVESVVPADLREASKRALEKPDADWNIWPDSSPFACRHTRAARLHDAGHGLGASFAKRWRRRAARISRYAPADGRALRRRRHHSTSSAFGGRYLAGASLS